MSKQPQWWDMLKKAPAWISGAISFATAVIGFVLLVQGNIQIGVIVLVSLVVVFILGACLYLVFARTEPLVEGGKGVYRFEKYRLWAMFGIGLTVGLTGMVLLIMFIPVITLEKPTPTTEGIEKSDCIPSSYLELPSESIAVIEPLKSKGATTQVPYTSLQLKHRSGLQLASGIMVEFKEMKRFELFNPGFNTDFAADIVITFLDCTTLEDRILTDSGSFLTAETEHGPLELYLLDVQRVEFEW